MKNLSIIALIFPVALATYVPAEVDPRTVDYEPCPYNTTAPSMPPNAPRPPASPPMLPPDPFIAGTPFSWLISFGFAVVLSFIFVYIPRKRFNRVQSFRTPSSAAFIDSHGQPFTAASLWKEKRLLMLSHDQSMPFSSLRRELCISNVKERNARFAQYVGPLRLWWEYASCYVLAPLSTVLAIFALFGLESPYDVSGAGTPSIITALSGTVYYYYSIVMLVHVFVEMRTVPVAPNGEPDFELMSHILLQEQVDPDPKSRTADLTPALRADVSHLTPGAACQLHAPPSSPSRSDVSSRMVPHLQVVKGAARLPWKRMRTLACHRIGEDGALLGYSLLLANLGFAIAGIIRGVGNVFSLFESVGAGALAEDFGYNPTYDGACEFSSSPSPPPSDVYMYGWPNGGGSAGLGFHDPNTDYCGNCRSYFVAAYAIAGSFSPASEDIYEPALKQIVTILDAIDPLFRIYVSVRILRTLYDARRRGLSVSATLNKAVLDVEDEEVAKESADAAPSATVVSSTAPQPTAVPTAMPTAMPTAVPIAVPTAVPISSSTANRTAVPTAVPTAVAVAVPKAGVANAPTAPGQPTPVLVTALDLASAL